MRVAVAGGTGRIGRLVVDRLAVRGHVAVVLSRSAGVDLLVDDPALVDRLAGVEVVVDVTSLPSADGDEAERVYPEVTRRLFAAGAVAGVRHHVALSISCLDTVVGGSHYVGKRAQERAVKAGSIPWTIVRATQFHDFPAMVAERSLTDGVAEIAPMLLQPVAPRDVADVLVEAGEADPLDGTLVLAGPATEDAVDMARRTFAAVGRPVVLRPTWQGTFGIEFAGEVMLPGPGSRIGPTSFDDWLASLGSGGVEEASRRDR